MPYAATTKSNQVAQGVSDTLIAYLVDYIDTEAIPATHYHLQNGAAIIKGAMCPAICIDDLGSKVLEKSAHGKNEDGSFEPGYVLEEYRLDLQVWLKGRKGTDMRALINTWRDGIGACFDDHWSLNVGAVQINAESSDPAFSAELDSATLWVGVVNVTVQAYSLQGSTTLLNT